MRLHPFELRKTGAQRGPLALLALAIVAAASTQKERIPPLVVSFPTDTVTTTVVAKGILERHIHTSKGPWTIEVLDVDLTRGYCAVAVKGANAAAGRKKVSALLTELQSTREVFGGVNADFFTLNGFQGMPTGALVSNGRVVVGPGSQPVVSIDGTGTVTLGTLRSASTVRIKGTEESIANWNRPGTNGLAVYDASWGAKLDTATGAIEVVLDGKSTATVVRVDTVPAGSEVPANGYVLIAGRNAPARQRSELLGLEPGDHVDVHLDLAPFHPVEAVGGRPMLVRDSAVVPEVETEGQASFRARNPRTALGLANKGRRLLLVVIDGREFVHSDGTTLRETAEIMLALGARDAINLDGGGSSTLVYPDSTKAMHVANKPSDPTGERPVGDALAIVKGCGRP
jgi:hypothetical protein